MPRRRYSEAALKRKRLQLQLRTDQIKFRHLKIADEAAYSGNYDIDVLVARANLMLGNVDRQLDQDEPETPAPY